MPKQRTLDDLYRVDEAVEFDDGTIDADTGAPLPPVTVTVRKLSKIDRDVVDRKANAARAVVLIATRDPASDAYLETYAQVWDEGDDRRKLIGIVLDEDVLNQTLSVQAELEGAEDSEWGKDGYLQGLTDAWRTELADRFQTDPNDADARRVFGELKRYSEAVASRMNAWWEDQEVMHADFDIDALRDMATRRALELRAEEAWEDEHATCTVWRAVRLPDNPRAYFFAGDDGLDRVRHLPDEVFGHLLDTYRRLSVGVLEGKGSPGIPASSPSSESPAPEETPVSSGPTAATA